MTEPPRFPVDTSWAIPKPTACAIARYHRPAPMRFVLHHIQPQVCGGPSTVANLVGLCDSCHYSVHVLLWHLSQGTTPPMPGTRKQRAYAQQGYEACLAAGTQNKIPKESDL